MRQRPLSKEEIDRAYLVFGINLPHRIASCTSYENAEQEFERCRSDAKKRFKELAFEKHPDRGGDEAEFKKIVAAWNIVDQIKRIGRPQPVRERVIPFGGMRVFVQFNGGFGGFGGTATTSTTSTGGFDWW